MLIKKAWFPKSEYQNSQNTRIWGAKNPYPIIEELLYFYLVNCFIIVETNIISVEYRLYHNFFVVQHFDNQYLVLETE